MLLVLSQQRSIQRWQREFGGYGDGGRIEICVLSLLLCLLLYCVFALGLHAHVCRGDDWRTWGCSLFSERVRSCKVIWFALGRYIIAVRIAVGWPRAFFFFSLCVALLGTTLLLSPQCWFLALRSKWLLKPDAFSSLKKLNAAILQLISCTKAHRAFKLNALADSVL